MRSALVPILLNSVPGWVRSAYPGVWPTISLAAHFDTGNYWAQGLGQVSADTLFACTRASTKYVPNAAGVLVPIASGLLPIVVGTGNSIEQAASCLALWNRDLTNANWTASSVTPLKDQVGMDGVVNSASSLLATGTNGTLTAAGITSASASRTVTMGVMRLIGTGPVSISQDGGATFTAITTKVGASWYIPTPTDFAGLTQTVTNPQIVIKLGTSGDKIAVDFIDLEAGAINTSPIATTSVAVTRAADDIVGTFSNIGAKSTLYVAGRTSLGVSTDARISFSDGTTNNRLWVQYDGANLNDNQTGNGVGSVGGSSVAVAKDTLFKTATAFDGTSVTTSVNGAGAAGTGTAYSATPTILRFANPSGSIRYWNNYIRRVAVFNTALSLAQQNILTANP